MSRSYRITVEESLSRVIKSEDKVETCLEMLEILPKEEMGACLEEELKKEGYEKNKDGLMEKKDENLIIQVDTVKGTVSVKSESCEAVDVTGEHTGSYYEEMDKNVAEKNARDKLMQDLEKKIAKKNEDLDKAVTEKLESKLGDIKEELDRAVNRTTAESLKIKAGRMGKITEISQTEDSLKITVEV